LIVVRTVEDKTPEAIRDATFQALKSPVWVSSADSDYQVDNLTMPGSGPLDNEGDHQIAYEHIRGGWIDD
jgi:hypothetical protein